MATSDDIKGLPDVDLTAIVSDLEKTHQEEQPQQQTQTQVQPQQDQELDLAQFKNPKDLLKGYKEIQAYTTRVSQENKTMKEQLAKINEELEMARIAQSY